MEVPTPESRTKVALVAPVVSVVFFLVQASSLSLAKRPDLDLPGIALGAVMLYGAGLLFAAQLALAAWVVGLPHARRHAPWLAMALGQPAVLVGSVMVAFLMQGAGWLSERAAGRVTVWLAAIGALVLVVTVARRRSGRWSFGGLVGMTIASAAWTAANGTELFSGLLPSSDLGFLLAVATWQVPFSSAYSWWAWSEHFSAESRSTPPSGHGVKR
jgi:hypothetical protein